MQRHQVREAQKAQAETPNGRNGAISLNSSGPQKVSGLGEGLGFGRGKGHVRALTGAPVLKKRTVRAVTVTSVRELSHRTCLSSLKSASKYVAHDAHLGRP